MHRATSRCRPGQTATCTLTNDDVAPQLTVIKHVVNDDGGTAVASDWQMHVTQGGNDVSGSPFAGAESPGTTRSVATGTYNVSESGGPSGYALTYSGDCNAQGNVTVALGQSATCTLTNDDQQPSLTVIKHVVNDDGGSAVASDWQMHVTQGGNDVSGSPFAGAESPGTTKAVDAGSYNVSESGGPSGYALSYSGDCNAQGNVTVAPGQSATCTLTNDDQAASITVIKHVVNDDGGSAVASDWQMHVTQGGNDVSGSPFAGAESPGTTNPVSAGTYNVSESGGPSGYALTYSGDCNAQGNVTVASGGSATCTLTNDDQQASLTVIKHVVNDNGGTAIASDWQMHVKQGGSDISGSPFAGGESPGTTKSVSAGAYALSESGGPANYTLSYSGDCDAQGNVTVASGASATCTLTNDDQAAHLRLLKTVVNDNGGTAVPSDFTLSANGPTPISGTSPVSSNVNAGSYTLSETNLPGYTAGSWSCQFGGTFTAPNTIALKVGQSATCTITNDDQPATLIVKKVVVNDNGGTKTASDFSFQVNGGQAQSFEADGQNNLAVNAGTYDVTEPATAGYTTTYANCDGIELGIGETATCTITNNDVPAGQGSISVSKSADPTSVKEPGGPVTFSVRVTNTSLDVDVVITNVVDDKFGDLDDDGGSGCFDVPITLHPGGFVSCQFTKQVTGDGGTTHVDTVTASGHDENGHPVSASDSATVTITPRLIDLVMVKTATSPTPLNGTVHYAMTVTNKGPDTATNVQLADPAPAGITYLSATASQGTCTVTPVLITCSLGSIASGQTVTVNATGKSTSIGSHTNTATVTGGGGRETNPADNVDSAVTVTPAPIKPPKTKPQPKPQPCLALTVTPKMIKADGKPDKVVAKVTAGKRHVKGAKVLVQGAGVKKSGRTNAKGTATIKVNPQRAGLITISTPEVQHSCGPRRIGVVGVFLPPVTG